MTNRDTSMHDRETADNLLTNWGRWCRDDWHKRLGYALPPTSSQYHAPRGEKPPPSPPINIVDAEAANVAWLHLRLREWPRDDIPTHIHTSFMFIVDRWAGEYSQKELARKWKCSERTIRRRQVRALDDFWFNYSEVVQFLKKTTCAVSGKSA